MNQAINPTRKNGTGSLAHEMGHALDNYLARRAGYGAGSYYTNVMWMRAAGDGLPVHGQLSEATAAALRAVTLSMMWRPGTEEPYSEPSEWLRRSRAKDGETTRGGRPTRPYWSKPVEMFARGFECWVNARMNEMGISNPYLTSQERFDYVPEFFPEGAEAVAVTAAFDRLAEALQVPELVLAEGAAEPAEAEQTPYLYSRAISAGFNGRGAMVEYAYDEVARVLGECRTGFSFRDELFDADGKPVSGRYGKMQQASRDDARRLISLSWQHADRGTVNHEVFHGAMELLLPQHDRQIVLDAFAPDNPNVVRLQHALSALGKDYLCAEVANNPGEAAAYAYELWRDHLFAPKPAVSGVFQRVRTALNDILHSLTNMGYPSVEAIFSDIATGQYRE